MNKKEVTEIKKQFTPSNCAITRICGCYVDGEKEKKKAEDDTEAVKDEEKKNVEDKEDKKAEEVPEEKSDKKADARQEGEV